VHKYKILFTQEQRKVICEENEWEKIRKKYKDKIKENALPSNNQTNDFSFCCPLA